MEEVEKYPSLPTNYVSLVQLQERWHKEQERKQKEEKERKQRKQEQKRKENPKNQKQNDNGERKTVPNSVSKNLLRFDRNRNSEGSQSENIRVQDEQKSEESKKNMRNPRVEENLTGGNQLEEKIPEGNGEKDEVRSEIRGNGYVCRPVEIGRNFEDMSLYDGREDNVRSQRNYSRDYSGRLDRPKMEKGRKSRQVWVKKGERIDADAAGPTSSGTL